MPKPTTVLVVDDDPIEQDLITRAFGKAGFGCQIRAVKYWDQAVEYLNGEGDYKDRENFPLPDLIILDHSMPGNGCELLKWLRTDPQLQSVPVVVFSGSSNPADESHAMKLGANAYHSKPQAFDEYVQVVKRIGEFWLRNFE